MVDLKHKKSLVKVAICMKSVCKMPPENGKNILEAEENPMNIWPSQFSKNCPPFFMGRKHRICSRIVDPNFLVGGWTNPSEKYARQIGSFFLGRDEHKTYLKPPPSSRFVHELEHMWKYEINNYSPNMMIKWVLENMSKERTHKNKQLPKYLCWFMFGRIVP